MMKASTISLVAVTIFVLSVTMSVITERYDSRKLCEWSCEEPMGELVDNFQYRANFTWNSCICPSQVVDLWGAEDIFFFNQENSKYVDASRGGLIDGNYGDNRGKF
jgi:hypothetical protein